MVSRLDAILLDWFQHCAGWVLFVLIRVYDGDSSLLIQILEPLQGKGRECHLKVDVGFGLKLKGTKIPTFFFF